MSDLSKILRATNIGKLNSHSLKRFELMKDKYNYDKLSAARVAITEVYSKALDRTPKGPYNAICLAATQDPLAKVPGIPNPSGELKIPKSGYLVKVIARIEEIHAAIPKPILTGPARLNCKTSTNLAILLHPVFYAISETQGQLPEPGNIVSVDFLDISDKSYGQYIGLVDDNLKACKEFVDSAAKAMEKKTESTNAEAAAAEAAAAQTA
jgi:hypothetical protein